MTCTSRANVFLIVNLGCEMLYVIDQRLKAQEISVEKSTQGYFKKLKKTYIFLNFLYNTVIRDITSVLLDPKFIERLINGSQQRNAILLTVEDCKFMLHDIACCSLMRLDEYSMNKLWSLMTMLFKWQLFVSKYPQHLLDITFRHLEACGKIFPDANRTILIEHTKTVLLDFWDSVGDIEQMAIYRTCRSWLECFNNKVSLLIRLGFQGLDATFIHEDGGSFFKDFVEIAGDNIYTRSVEILKQRKEELSSVVGVEPKTRKVDQLAKILSVNDIGLDSEMTNNTPVDELRRNILFDDMVVGRDASDFSSQSPQTENTNLSHESGAFVRLKPLYTPTPKSATSWEDFVSKREGADPLEELVKKPI